MYKNLKTIKGFQIKNFKFQIFSRASSLIEVLVVMAIIGTTIISAMSLAANSLINVRNNELEQYANTILIKTVEKLKSPTDIRVSGVDLTRSQTGQTYYYKLTETSGVLLLEQDIFQTRLPDTCASGTAYYFQPSTIPEDSFTTPVCIQVRIKPSVTTQGRRFYEIFSTIVYPIGPDTTVSTMKVFRYTDFQNI